jgi:hypothetical protein
MLILDYPVFAPLYLNAKALRERRLRSNRFCRRAIDSKLLMKRSKQRKRASPKARPNADREVDDFPF